jgi:hypothetical protein
MEVDHGFPGSKAVTSGVKTRSALLAGPGDFCCSVPRP